MRQWENEDQRKKEEVELGWWMECEAQNVKEVERRREKPEMMIQAQSPKHLEPKHGYEFQHGGNHTRKGPCG